MSTAQNGSEGAKVNLATVDRRIAEGLFALLDEIDTISDLAKDNDQLYRKLVENVQRRRFEFATTDGYSVIFKRGIA